MELIDLQFFRAVAESGGITRASERLHRVQSNVSKRIRGLEEELGIPLFDRDGRGVRVTEQGRVLLDFACRMLSLAEEAKATLRAAAGNGVLRIGSMEGTATLRLPLPLAALRVGHPQVR